MTTDAMGSVQASGRNQLRWRTAGMCVAISLAAMLPIAQAAPRQDILKTPRNLAHHHLVRTGRPQRHPARSEAIAPRPPTTPLASDAPMQPAPVPDPNITAPVPIAPDTIHTTPKLFSVTHDKLGDGYTYGSSSSA